MACGFFGFSAHAALGDLAGIKEHSPNPYTITFDVAPHDVRLSFIAPNIVRVHMAKGDAFTPDDLHLEHNGPYAVVNYDWSKTGVSDYQITDGGTHWSIAAGELIVKVQKSPFRLEFSDSTGSLLTRETSSGGLRRSGSTVSETMEMRADEHFIGFGAWHHNVDFRGRSVPMRDDELGECSGDGCGDEGGFKVPWFMSNAGYGIFFNNLDPGVQFHMGTSQGEYAFGGPSGDKEGWCMDYYLIYGPKFVRMMTGYITITGRPILAEKWFLGHLHNGRNWSADDVMRIAKRFRNGGWPIDGILFDSQWRPRGANLTWASSFSNYKEMHALLDSLHLQTMTHENMGTTYSEGTCGCCQIRNNIDPTDMEKVACMWELHKKIMQDGVDFWKLDNGETYGGTSSNGYPLDKIGCMLAAKYIYEGSVKDFGRYVPQVARAGAMGGHRYIMPWAGDMGGGWANLRVDMRYSIGGGLAGYIYATTDIGGFRWDPIKASTDLAIRRWIHMFLVHPTHYVQGQEGYFGDFKEPALSMCRFYGDLRYRLNPYLYSHAIEGHLFGRPIVAPIAFYFQDDVNTFARDFDYMFGKSILVAPVLDEGENTRDVYLPEGRWIHYHSGDEYKSPGKLFAGIPAPVDQTSGLPMFIPEGAIIPMMPYMNYIYEKPPDPITLDIYPKESGSSSFTRYDAETPASPITQTVYTCRNQPNGIVVDISPSSVSYELVMHAGSAPYKVIVDGVDVENATGKAGFDAAAKAWYHGPGIFYGNSTLATTNVKFPGGANVPHRVIVQKGVEPIGVRRPGKDAPSPPKLVRLPAFGGLKEISFEIRADERVRHLAVYDARGNRLAFSRDPATLFDALHRGGSSAHASTPRLLLVQLKTDKRKMQRRMIWF